VNDDPHGDEPTMAAGIAAGPSAAFELFLACIALGIGWLTGFAPLDAFDWNGADAAWGIVAAGPMIAFWRVASRLNASRLAPFQQFLWNDVRPLFARLSFGEMALISLAAGVGEELLFRGLVQFGLARAIDGSSGVVVGVAIASVMFALAHAMTTSYAVLAGATSVYLGAIFLATGNLLTPIVAHGAYDLFALWDLTRLSRPPAQIASPSDREQESS
jgi:hypothetical protein